MKLDDDEQKIITRPGILLIELVVRPRVFKNLPLCQTGTYPGAINGSWTTDNNYLFQPVKLFFSCLAQALQQSMQLDPAACMTAEDQEENR